jgi:hypothetical protein
MVPEKIAFADMTKIEKAEREKKREQFSSSTTMCPLAGFSRRFSEKAVLAWT